MKRFVLLLPLLLLWACHKQPAPATLSVYYWKTHFSLDTPQRQFLSEYAIQKLYIRYCDIILSGGEAIPDAPVELDTITLKDKEVIPVIYLKNEVFLSDKVSAELLAEKLSKYIAQINHTYNLTVKEVQLDCDWSLRSKERYFDFIKYFKTKTPYQLSATIRLHQVKYHDRTGIPPVNYGVLMYYNMGKITATGANSIYDRATAEKYLPALCSYPLPLKVALPIFSWGVHSIAGEVTDLVGGFSFAEADTLSQLSRMGNSDCYLVTEAMTYKGQRWQKGDVIKVEEISQSDLLTMKADLTKYLKSAPKEIILYDLNKNIDTYEKNFFKKLR